MAEEDTEKTPQYRMGRYGYLERDYSQEGYARNRYGYWVPEEQAERPPQQPASTTGLSISQTQAEQMRRVASDPRYRWGWGPSQMASPEEKRAYQALQVIPEIQAGRATVADLPKEYGGRPTGTSRRAIRMAAEYDLAQKEALERQRIMQQMDINQKELALREREQQSMEESRNIARDAAVAKAAREAKVKEQATAFMQSVIGAALPDGTRTRPINVNDDDAVERIQRAMYMNPFGMEDQYAKETATMMLDDAMRIREQKANEIAAQDKAATESRVAIAKDLAASGLSIADYSKDGVVDFEAANTALGKALKEKEEGREAAIDEREQRRTLRRQKATTETELVKIKAQIGRFEKLRPTANNLQELEAARVSQAIFEDDINRINRELGEEPQAPAEAETARELSPRDQSALDWANANPDDPRSQRIKQRLGVE